MLGAVKGDPQTEHIPLFRLLARRWQPLAPVLCERKAHHIVDPAGRQATEAHPRLGFQEPARDLRQPDGRAVHIEARLNPWLWMK